MIQTLVKNCFGIKVKLELVNGIWRIHLKINIVSGHKKYIEGELIKEEFLKWYRNPKNYRPEGPSANRSHKYE
ncbi:GH-E family nuclease [Virgibacillus proomii]|uniref:GH-E family nuclease n=1 Tax=Virgibacillus proomii TaxID=84407 RepID=UPI002481D849|nr:GH-E family nuclease [Virgibacillus proomii]